MTTYRVPKRTQFARIERALLEDKRLSFRARGILAWLLAKPDGWECDGRAIANATEGEGRDAVYAALKEMVALGYLERKRWQDPDTKQWQSVSHVHECPIAPNPGFQDPVSQDSASQDPGNQELSTNDDDERRRDPLNPPSIQTEDGEIPLPPPSTEAYARNRSGADLAPHDLSDSEREEGLAHVRALRSRRTG